jgi:uncharacterized protein (TIGR02271 family)
MNDQTLVAVYDTAAHADAAVSDLRSANVPAEAISQHTKSEPMPDETRSPTGAAPREQGFWARLFGAEPDHDTTVYDRSIESGATVVTVRVPAEHFERISALLEKHDPIDMDERAAQYGSPETTTTRTTAVPGMTTGETTPAPTEEGTLDLSEEVLSVGKRAVSGGTTRIRRYVVETPVRENVTLHTEKVSLDRRPVTDSRAVDGADFTERAIEMTETSEEAVVAKTARVKEEVSLRKVASDVVETVKDTVRHDEVEVEQIPGDLTSHAAGAAPAAPLPSRGKI